MRGSLTMEPNLKVSTTNIMKNTSTYANATKQEIFPTREQSIILDVVDEVSIKDYVSAIGKISGPAAIRLISKISNNRIWIYLDNKETVKNLTTNHNYIIIDNKTITIRPMIIPAQRIMLSNVPPIIPHSQIEEIFKNNNIRLNSKITFLRAGIMGAEFSHILSFRRQIYVNPEDIKSLYLNPSLSHMTRHNTEFLLPQTS